MRLRDWITLGPVFLRCVGKLPMRHLWLLGRRMSYEHPHRHGGMLYLNTFFPPYPSAGFERFLANVLSRQRVPYSVYFAVTDRCPYRCGHCSYGKRPKGRLDTQGTCEIIKQIKGIGAATIGLTGGEPLLREDIATLVETVGPECSSIIFSTGYGLTGELGGRLGQAGLKCLMIGLESDDGSVHDAVRQSEGSFETAMRAIEQSLAAGLYTAISTIGTREKIADGSLVRMAELGERLGVHEFRILEPVATGSWQKQRCELTEQDSKQVSGFHRHWNRRGKGPAIASFSWLESDAMFGCGAGYHHLFIDAMGNVCPCDLTPLSFGNACEEPLAGIWQRMERYFPRPRCACFMRDAARGIEKATTAELPVGYEESCSIAGRYPHNGQLPALYNHYFKEP